MLPKKRACCSANRIDEGQGVREMFLGEEELVLSLGVTAYREQTEELRPWMCESLCCVDSTLV